jgi:hypothetical protein
MAWPIRPMATMPWATGYIGVMTLGFNPNPPHPSSHLCATASGNVHRFLHLISSTSIHLTGASRRCRSLPLHSPPAHLLPPWLSRPLGQIPSTRSATRAAQFCEVGKAAEDLAPDGTPERWWFTCGGAVVTGPLGGSGGGSQTPDLVSYESGLASLASILGARVSVGRSRSALSACAPVLVA